mgnify:CR=1 FL=1
MGPKASRTTTAEDSSELRCSSSTNAKISNLPKTRSQDAITICRRLAELLCRYHGFLPACVMCICMGSPFYTPEPQPELASTTARYSAPLRLARLTTAMLSAWKPPSDSCYWSHCMQATQKIQRSSRPLPSLGLWQAPVWLRERLPRRRSICVETQ